MARGTRAWDDLAIARFISEHETYAGSSGLRLELSTDFSRLETLCEATGGRGGLDPCFSPRYFDLTPAHAAWIGGWSENGTLLHTQAIRVDNLGGLSLAEHWRQQMRRLYADPIPGVAFERFCTAVDRLGGTIAYHGAMWSHPDSRRAGLGSALSRLQLAIALNRFDPDWVYGFVSRDLIFSGYGLSEGYLHYEPCAITWSRDPGLFDPNDWLVYMTRHDLLNLVKQPVSVAFEKPSMSRAPISP